jgi:hypothetical protein
MADNKQIKDGLGNLFNLRMRDVGPAQDGLLMKSMFDAAMVPIEYGAGGMYQHTARSGLMAAGLAASSPIYSFCWQSATLLVAVQRIRLTAFSVGAFTAGTAAFNLFVARGFTVQDGGGAVIDLSGNHAKLRTSMATSVAAISCATTAALSPGARTLDADPAAASSSPSPGPAMRSWRRARHCSRNRRASTRCCWRRTRGSSSAAPFRPPAHGSSP